MLFKSLNLIDPKSKQGPYYIVGELHRDGALSYIKHLGAKLHPCFPQDEILEQTDELWEAQLFCRREDATAVMKERCGFRCNCDVIHNVGKTWEVTASNRSKEGVTYGLINCTDRERFETVFDVREVESHTQ